MQLSTASQQLQLLYSDQTEELLAGHDFCELLRNGHLALAAGHAPPPESASELAGNACRKCLQERRLPIVCDDSAGSMLDVSCTGHAVPVPQTSLHSSNCSQHLRQLPHVKIWICC